MASTTASTMEASTALNENNRLLAVPLEVLLHITSHLSTPDYGHVRRTCRRAEALLFGPFAQEFFTKKQFFFAEFSLKHLVAISESRFAPCMKYLIINIGNLAFLLRMPSRVTERATPKQLNRLNDEVCKFTAYMEDNHDLALLTKALDNLPNLVTLGLRDFNSNTRYRDNTVWRPYGSNTLARETGYDFSLYSAYQSLSRYEREYVLRRLFRGLLQAVAKVHRQQRVVGSERQSLPTRLEVILRHGPLGDSAFALPDHMGETISPVLTDLKALFLVIDGKDLGTYIGDPSRPTNYSQYHLSHFLYKAQSLEHLRLNLVLFRHTDIANFFGWLAGDPNVVLNKNSEGNGTGDGDDNSNNHHENEGHVPPWPPTPAFSRLEVLEIGMVAVKPQMLLAVIRRYKSTLRSISLHRIRLEPDFEPNNNKEVNLWYKLLGQVRYALRLLLSQNSFLLSSNPCFTFKPPFEPKF
ncbi:hypothetical protein F4780DRAFT_733770 [Xylariomycetidae sp. FL0641]|nr:hypothetical protein F4780DRAFT_733770 [Xylariomycetidae sp. FL0641]